MDITRFLKANVKPATGCTEPIAVGYAVSLAYNALIGRMPPDFKGSYLQPKARQLEKIHIKTDRDVYKNALAIKIPGTNGQKGIAIAAAMGFYALPEKELDIFNNLDNEIIFRANNLISQGKVAVEKVDDTKDTSDLDISVSLDYLIGTRPRNSYVRLQHEHTNISEIRVDNKIVYQNGLFKKTVKRQEEIPDSIDELLHIIKNATDKEKNEVYKGIEMNMKMAEAGLSGKYGLAIGKSLSEMASSGVIANSIITEIKIMAAAAGDARMGGADMPVMSTSGSGNQGITALVPLAVIGKKYNISKEKLSEAALLSHIITKKISNYSGYLSAICGCAIKAGIGAAAGVTYLLGGDSEKINNAINLMAANLTGMVCDGAKEGCALKLSTAAATAAESAFMAMANISVPGDNGIVNRNANETMKNIGKISKEMVKTDLKIVEIMQSKAGHAEAKTTKPHFEDPFGERMAMAAYKARNSKA